MHANYRIIISISSDIGFELAKSWLKNGDKVIGTYRTWNTNLDEISNHQNLTLLKLNFDRKHKIKTLPSMVRKLGTWEVLVIAAGRQEPIGNFEGLNFSDWTEGVRVNFLDQINIVHQLLPIRSKSTDTGPSVLFFAGGGTNNSVNNYSAYTISKISLIKMCELLSTEIPSVKFSIVGPGWVKTKIHLPTIIDSGKQTGENFKKTVEMLAGNDCVPISNVIESCNWIINQQTKIVSGRNFSTKLDQFNQSLINKLSADEDMYKLRRDKNNWTK